MKIRRLLTLAIILTATVGVAQAQTQLYSVAPPAGSFIGWTASVNTSFNGWAPFDDFILSSTSLVNRVRWRGWAWDPTTPANNPVTPAIASARIFVAQDSASQPGTIFHNQLAATLTSTLVGTATLGSGQTVRVFDYTADLDTSVLLAGGTRYWISPSLVISTPNVEVAWIGTNSGTLYQKQVTNGSFGATFERTGSMSLALFGSTSVPEPGTFLFLMLGALSGVGVLRRRTSR